MRYLLFVIAFLLVALTYQIVFFVTMQTYLVYNVIMLIIVILSLFLCSYVLYRRLKQRSAVAKTERSAAASEFKTYD